MSTAKQKLKQWRQDPVAFSRAIHIRRPDETIGPVKLSPRQQAALRALAGRDGNGPRYKTVALVWPKRSGKTLLAAIGVLWKSLWPRRLSILLSNSREQSVALTYEMMTEALELSPALKASAKALKEETTFAWGSKVRVVPCNSRTVAGVGVSGILVADELWASYSEEPYHLLHSQADGAEAQCFLVSQASGRQKYVHRLWEQQRDDPDPATFLDYIEPDELPEGNPNPYLTPAFFASRRRALPKYLFQLYFENRWGEGGQALLDGELVEQACTWQAPGPEDELGWANQLARWRQRGLSLGAGLDRALPMSGRDESVWTVCAAVAEEDGVHYHVCRQTVLPTGREPEVVAEAERSREIFGPCPAHLEAYQCADLVEKVPAAKLVHPTAGKQQELFSRLARATQDARLRVPEYMTRLRQQLLALEVDTSDTGRGHARFGAPGLAADDCVYSLAWALDAASISVPSGEVKHELLRFERAR